LRLGGVAGDQAAFERDQPDRDEPGLRAERKDLLEGVGQGLPMTSAKAGDRGVVWGLVGAQTRKATSSRQRRSMPREERSPTA
jgi:hypothetical protein